MWIIKGDRKWSSIGHSNSQSYTWIASNIPDATLVCDDRNNHGIPGTYSSYRAGSYTFEANTLYTILVKVTEHGGGAGLYLGISDSNLSNQSRRNTTFPSQFYANAIVNTVSGSVDYTIESGEFLQL